MLAYKNRITKKEEFGLVARRGKSYKNKLFVLSYLDRGDNGPTRFGFIVTKKISPHATRRNMIIRMLREAVRQNLFFVKDGYDCVMVARAGSSNAYSDEIVREVKSSLPRAKLIK